MSTTLHPTEARSRKRSSYGGARRWGTPNGEPVKRDSPSKRERAASDALNAVLELFESGSLPAAIAQTVIARAEHDSPSSGWSLGNQLLCVINGTADARGYRQWQEVGRHVTKGAKAFYILAPRTRKIRETDNATGEQHERVIVSGFLGIPVFRFEDTEGLPLERFDYAPPVCPPLSDVAERLGVPVSYVPFVDRFRGYYSPGDDRIVLCSHDVRTFFHELAHAAHRRVLESRGDVLKGGQRPNQEVVAETVAATLCHLLDVEADSIAHSADYVRSYSRDGSGNAARAAMRCLTDIQAVLQLILDYSTNEASSELEAVAA